MTKKWNPDDYGSPSEDAASKAQLEAEARRRGMEPWRLSAARAVPTDVVRGLVEDAYRSNPVTGGGSMAQKPVERGTGWYEPKPLGPSEHQRYVDQLCIADAERQKLEEMAKLQEQLRKLQDERRKVDENGTVKQRRTGR
jgi:hypothetical protein